jgi:hypothetical protein
MLKMSYIGDVADISYLVTEMLEQFDKNIISHSRSCMAEVCITVHCRAADIKSYVSFVDRFKEFFLSRK